MNVLTTAALDYRGRGWAVIPVRGKLAACPWKRWQRERPDENALRRLFAADGISGLAVILGEVSGGLVARDYDELDGYRRWASDRPDLASRLPTVQTARGRHVYFRNGERRIVHLGDGELRGNGYCLLPPSRHPGGMEYRWSIPLHGELPHIADPAAVGLVPERLTRAGAELAETVNKTENRNNVDRFSCVTERTERTEAIREGEGEREEGARGASAHKPENLDSAILTTLPTKPGERNRRLFDFARALRALPEYADAKPQQLRPAVRRWHTRALPFIETADFDTTWFDFLYGWTRVKFPLGADPMVQVFARAVEAVKAESPDAVRRYERPELRLLVALCYELQRASGERAFYLACRTAAALIGVDRMTANRWLCGLVADSVLAVAEPGTKTKAARYRFVGGVE